jgi:hypothetical protein
MVLDVGARLGIIAQVATGMDSKPPACDATRGQRMPSDARDKAPPTPIRTVLSSQLGRVYLPGMHHLVTMLVATCGRFDPPVLAQRQDVVRAAGVPSHRRAHGGALRNVANYVAKGQLDVNLRAAGEIYEQAQLELELDQRRSLTVRVTCPKKCRSLYTL